MGRGVAALLAGVGTGYMTGQRMESERRREEREAARFGFERRRMEREENDQAAIRDAFTLPQQGRSTVENAGYTDLADATTANTQPVSAEDSAPTPARVIAVNGIQTDQRRAGNPEEDGDLRRYLERVKPRVIQTYLRQGKPEKAKAYLDFTESEEGRDYTRAWAGAMRKVAGGDFDGAIPSLEKLYTSIPDGQRARATHLGEGRYRLDFLDEKSGEVIRSGEQDSATLARSAAMFLDPARAVQWYATREAELAREQIADRRFQRQYEANAQREEIREDRRDERLQSRLDASENNLERRLSARGRLTATQERSNLEIDAAREYIAGLTPEEIRQRTTTHMASGRENPLFDNALSRAAKLASRRKVGENDPYFDQRQGQDQQPKPAATDGKKQTPIEAARAAMAADPAMKGYRLGQQTLKGFEVLDANGKRVGYFGKQ